MQSLIVPIVSLALLLGSANGQNTTFHAGTSEVAVNPEVLENGHSVANLQQFDFLLFDEDQPQRTTYFGHESVPLDLVLLLDTSGSVQKYLREIGAIANQALRMLHPEDRVAVMTFSRDMRIEQTFTSNRNEISQAIEAAATDSPAGSGTRIYAALTSAARYLGQTSAGVRRRAILIITDNDGMSYDVHQNDALRALFNAGITLDAIAVGRHPHPPAPRPGSIINPDFAFDDVLPVTDQTGGESIVTTKPKESLSGMLARLRDRYLLIYSAPSDAIPGSFRRIRVELAPAARQAHPHATINVRRGYYVNGPEQAGRE
jgi:VWFA-related protein